MSISKIIVHAGAAHLDEYMAVALLLADIKLSGGNPLIPIFRRDPTQAELDDPSTAVIDVGMVHDPKRLCFDHHQLTRGTRESAMGLVADYLGIRETIGKLFPWFETRVAVDSIGPFATANAAGVEWARVAKFLGPFEEICLAQFVDEPDTTRWAALIRLADMIIQKMDAYGKVKRLLVKREVDGVEVYDFLAADPSDVRAVSDALVGDRGVAVFHDDRGPGLTLLRLNDDARINFSPFAGDERIAFAHAGGFIAKTKAKLSPDVVDNIILGATQF